VARPLPLAAVATLLLNDHVFKGSELLPGWLTGKLSDFAGLFFFPILLVAVARPRCTPRFAAAVATLSTGAVFTAIKLVPAVNALATRACGPTALDPSDLLALPALGASWLWMARCERRTTHSSRPVLEGLGIVTAAFASVATSTFTPLAPRGDWYGNSCAEVSAISCSVTGRFDARLTVAVTNVHGEPCDVTVTSVLAGDYHSVESLTRFDSPPHLALAFRARESLTLDVSQATAFPDPPGETTFLLSLEGRRGTEPYRVWAPVTCSRQGPR
jgi:hypothetical protein